MNRERETDFSDRPSDLLQRLTGISKLEHLEDEGLKVHTLVKELDPTKRKRMSRVIHNQRARKA